MKRIDTPSRAIDLFGPGKHGFKDGNPLVGDVPTQLNAAQFNHMQEEIARVIESVNPLNPAKYTQLLEAIQAMIAAAISALPDLEVAPYGSFVNTADASFDILDEHANRVINFTAGGQTCNLPAVGGRSGMPVWLRNGAAAGDVTLDPTGAQTYDGFTTRLLRPGDMVRAVSNGATGWVTTAGLYSFVSGELACTLDFMAVVAHGLRKRPEWIEAWVVCKEAEGGYFVGQWVDVSAEAADGVGTLGITADETNITYRVGTNYGITIADHVGGVASTYIYITPSKWRLVLRAYAR